MKFCRHWKSEYREVTDRFSDSTCLGEGNNMMTRCDVRKDQNLTVTATNGYVYTAVSVTNSYVYNAVTATDRHVYISVNTTDRYVYNAVSATEMFILTLVFLVYICL